MTVIELANGVPALHPERKGMLNKSPLKNWIEKNGGLPTYINSFATAILRENPTWSISRVIATAVNMAKKGCATGRAFGGKVKVSKAVQTAMCAAVAQWEKKKISASEEFIDNMILLSMDEFDVLEVEKAKRRAKRREEGKEITESIILSDELFLEYAIVELSDDWGEGVNDDVDTDRYLDIMEMSAAPEMALRLPVIELGNAATVTAGGEFRKEIWRVGDINYMGRKVRFTSEMLKKAYQNFAKKPFAYVPFQFLHKSSAGEDHPRDYAGRITSLSLDDEDNPTKMFANFSLTDEAKKIVEHNPEFGVSVKIHPDFTHPSTGEHYGPTLLHVAGTHFPRLGEMGAWTAIKAGIDPEDETIDLSAGEFEGGIPDVNDEEEKEGGDNVADKTETQEQTLDLSAIMESDAFKNALKLAVDSQTEDLRTKNEALEKQVAEGRKENYTATVKAAVNTYRGAGVAPVMLDCAEALLLSLDEDQRNETIELSFTATDKDGKEEARTEKLSTVGLITKMLDNAKGTVDLGVETGSSEQPEDSDLSDEKVQDAAALELAALAGIELDAQES